MKEKSNMTVYNAVAEVPAEALKPISAGRLKGKSDINPMWRIKMLTEIFGPCGFGWKYTITKQWLEAGSGNEVAAFCNIELYVKQNGEWSDAIPGTGGSAFVASESKGPYTSDECYKMALTDAISVACKALGFGANVYWKDGRTKYSAQVTAPVQQDDQLLIAIDDLRRAKNRADLLAAYRSWMGIYGNDPEFNGVLQEMCNKYPKEQ